MDPKYTAVIRTHPHTMHKNKPMGSNQTDKLLHSKGNHTKIKKTTYRSSHQGAAEMNSTRNHEVVGSIPGLAQWVKDLALP